MKEESQKHYKANELLLFYCEKNYEGLYEILLNENIKKELDIKMPQTKKHILEDCLDKYDLETASFLLDAGVDSNIKSINGKTLCEKYFDLQNLHRTSLLISRGANPNFNLPDGRSLFRVLLTSATENKKADVFSSFNVLRIVISNPNFQLASSSTCKIKLGGEIYMMVEKLEDELVVKAIESIKDDKIRSFAIFTAFRARAVGNQNNDLNSLFDAFSANMSCKKLCITALQNTSITSLEAQGVKPIMRKIAEGEFEVAKFLHDKSKSSSQNKLQM